jgi:hypothetical protein
MKTIILILSVIYGIISIYFLLTGNMLYAIYSLGLFIIMGIADIHNKIDELNKLLIEKLGD